jgi:chemotaxis signal transduction protein
MEEPTPQHAGPDGAPPDEERAARVLAARARALAVRPGEAGEELVATLAFDAGGERYALPLGAALRVERVAGVARVPGSPAGYVGLVNLHGKPCPLVDVPALLGVPGAAPAARRWAVVLGARAAELALAADAVEIEGVPRARLHAAGGPRLGVTADARVVLDPAALLAAPAGEGAGGP